MNSAFAQDFYTRPVSHAKGVGLFAARKFEPGETLYALDYWSEPEMPMHATNHSCEPNAAFNSDSVLVALRVILPDEEITYDYLTIPLPASPWNFECECGAEKCRSRVIAK